MLKVKLFLTGRRNQRCFKIVVAERRSKRDGKFVDDLGFFNPYTKELHLDKQKLENWQKKGALLTEGVRKILTNQD